MSDIRKLPAVTDRVETGPIQFGDDWPGVFIRGDNAAYFAMALQQVVDVKLCSRASGMTTTNALKSLLSVMQSAFVSGEADQ